MSICITRKLLKRKEKIKDEEENMRSSYLYAWNDQCHDDVFPGILCKVLTEIYTKDNKSAQNANKGVLE